MTEIEFGRLQLRIMQALWEKKRATARDITTALEEFEPVDHKNVQTILYRLEKKGAVAHDEEQRAFIYYPLVNNVRVKHKEVSDFIERLFNGSAGELVSSMLDSENLSLEELKKIIEIVNDAGEKK